MKKNSIISGIVHLTSIAVIFSFFVFPENKYDWMQQIDTSITTLPTDNSAGSRYIFTVLCLVLVIIGQTYLAIKETAKPKQLFSVCVMLAAMATWLLKFF